mgnify:CR=1 FL=1
MGENSDPVYNADFIDDFIRRLHRYNVSGADAAGLAGMITPVDALADRAATDLGFDDEPADFLRVMRQQKRDSET